MRTKIFYLLIPTLLLALTCSAQVLSYSNYWFYYDTVELNRPIAADSGAYQGYPVALPYTNGSTIVVYFDERYNNCYQIIDHYGRLAFSEPQLLAPDIFHPYAYQAKAVADGYGGAFAAWNIQIDPPPGGNYVQRIDSLGNRMWGEAGIQLFHNWGALSISVDNIGGFLIAMEDGDIHAQKLSESGQVLWGENGVVVCDDPYQQDPPIITHDGSGGAYIAWRDYRPPHTVPYGALYMQKLDSTGRAMWTLNGVMMYENNPWNYDLIPDCEGGVILHCGSGNDNFAYRIDQNGHILWEQLDVSQWDKAQIVPGDSGFFYLGFHNWPDATEILAQKMDMDGNRYWGWEGTIVGSYNNLIHGYNGHNHNFAYRSPNLYAVYSFGCHSGGTPSFLLANCLDADGRRMWGDEGTLLAYEEDDMFNYTNAIPDPDVEEGAVFIWESYWGVDIFGKHVNNDGSLGGPKPVKIEPLI